MQNTTQVTGPHPSSDEGVSTGAEERKSWAGPANAIVLVCLEFKEQGGPVKCREMIAPTLPGGGEDYMVYRCNPCIVV